MQKNLTLTTLSTIGNACVEFGNLFESILCAGYGSSPAKAATEKRENESRRHGITQQTRDLRENKKRCRALIKRLEQQGLVERTLKRGKLFIRLTAKGTARLAHIQGIQELKETPATAHTEGARWIIIIFDIPEKKRSQRDWVRKTLTTMGFSMMQKSVWIGRAVLPRIFIETLAQKEIMSCVEILEITKEGSILRGAQKVASQRRCAQKTKFKNVIGVNVGCV